jgi:hypothetical protein
MWNKITVKQAQEIDKLRRNINKEYTEADVDTELLAIIRNTTIQAIDSMKWVDFVEARKELVFLENEPKAKPIKHIKVGKRRYRMVYDIRQMPFARYIEGKTFAQDFVQNLHKIAATMIMPQRRTCIRWVDDKYDAAKHDVYANDMLQAPYEVIYASAVFFCNLFKNWIIVSKDYMINELVSKGMTNEEAVKQVNDLCRYLDGIIPQNK